MTAQSLANKWAYGTYRREFTQLMLYAMRMAKMRKEEKRVGI